MAPSRDDYIKALFDKAIDEGSFTLTLSDERAGHTVRFQMNSWRRRLRDAGNLPPEYDTIVTSLSGNKLTMTAVLDEWEELFKRNNLPLPAEGQTPLTANQILDLLSEGDATSNEEKT